MIAMGRIGTHFITVCVSLVGGILLILTYLQHFMNVEFSIIGEQDSSNYVNWTELFDFVPNGLEKCTELFPDTDVSEEFQRKLDEFQKVVDQFYLKAGYSAKYREELLVSIKLVQAPFVKTVCETGFNAGHSAFTWLEANPNVHVYSFDLGTNKYNHPMAEHVSKAYPGRLTITWGDSRNTLPEFHQKYPNVTCDLIIIDGGHTYDACKLDFDVFRSMASRDNVVFLDNYPDRRRDWMTQLGDVWEAGKQRAEMAEVFHCVYFPEDKQGFSVGRYV